jgi:ATP phosphoribosyltransferase regulatory subunit
VARAAATLFASAARPLRFCYAASVFRQRPRSHVEWRRQGRQLGCELIGSASAAADLEVLAIAAEVLARLGLRYRVTLNHVGVFNGVAEQLGLDSAAREQMRQITDSRDVAELERFLSERLSWRPRALRGGRLVRLVGKGEMLDKAGKLITSARAREALDELKKLWGVLEALGLSDFFEVDLADVSGLDYYTGLVFKIYAEGAGARVGSGGRYDELTANFGRREPATGFVLDLDTVTEVLARAGDFELKNGKAGATALVGAADTCELLREAKQRRARGERIRLELGD